MHCVFCERYRWIVVGRNLICVLNLVPRAFPHPFFKGKALGTRLLCTVALGGGGGAPSYDLQGVVTLDRVWFLTSLS